MEVVSVRDASGPVDRGISEKRALMDLLIGGLLGALAGAASRKEQIVMAEIPVCPDCINRTEFDAQFTDFKTGKVGVLVHARLRDALAEIDRRRSSS
ncbi:MAG: hypothetical protein HZA52_04150 [Planctomycetes bacterium]|nr:hypothetical protein [Planctomycetota bacterium]